MLSRRTSSSEWFNPAVMVNSLVTDRIRAALKAQKSNKEAETNPATECALKRKTSSGEGEREEVRKFQTISAALSGWKKSFRAKYLSCGEKLSKWTASVISMLRKKSGTHSVKWNKAVKSYQVVLLFSPWLHLPYLKNVYVIGGLIAFLWKLIEKHISMTGHRYDVKRPNHETQISHNFNILSHYRCFKTRHFISSVLTHNWLSMPLLWLSII